MTATRAQRKRRGVEVTLSAEARERLRGFARMHPNGTASAVVEDLVMGDADMLAVAIANRQVEK